MEKYQNIIQFSDEVKKFGFLKKSPTELSQKRVSLYRKISRYAEQYGLWSYLCWLRLGMSVSRIDGLNSLERLDDLIEHFNYRGSSWRDFPLRHRNAVREFIDTQTTFSFEAFLHRYDLTNKERAYDSIKEIKKDLAQKGLYNSSIAEIARYDGEKTYANIQSYAEHVGMSLAELWFILEIQYNQKIEIVNGKPKMKFAYNHLDEIKTDFIAKELIGKTVLQVQRHDGSATYKNVVSFAQRNDILLANIWKHLNISKELCRRTDRINYQIDSLNRIKTLIKELELNNKNKKDIRVGYPDFYKQVAKWCEKNEISLITLWEEVGINRSQGFASIEHVVEEIMRGGYTNPQDLRKNNAILYKRISGFMRGSTMGMQQVWNHVWNENPK